MPIVDPDDSAPPAPKPSPPQVAVPTYRGVTVDTKVVAVSDLLTHVQGSSWTVNYYSQVLNADNAPAGQGLGTNPVNQQYRLIRGMEFKVNTPLTASQDPESKVMTYEGSATIYPFVIPNEGDMFLADIGDGREGIFQITATRRLSIQKQTCHEVDYTLKNYSTEQLRGDLDIKTIERFQYDRDFLNYGQNPLLFEEEYQIVQWLRRRIRDMLETYLKSFFSREYATLLVPGQPKPTYDHFLTQAVLSYFTTFDSHELRNIRIMNVEEDYALRATQVWDAITRRDPLLMRQCFTQVGKVWHYEFDVDPMMEGIHHSGIKEVIYPLDPILTVDYNQVSPPKLVSGSPIVTAPVDMRSVGDFLNAKPIREQLPEAVGGFSLVDNNGNPVETFVPPPLIKRAMENGYYVFSEQFYKNNRTAGQQSILELMVHDYLEGKALSFKRLKALCEDVPEWNALDRFYFVPVLLVLMKAAVRSI
jgi:hypothetical protein